MVEMVSHPNELANLATGLILVGDRRLFLALEERRGKALEAILGREHVERVFPESVRVESAWAYRLPYAIITGNTVDDYIPLDLDPTSTDRSNLRFQIRGEQVSGIYAYAAQKGYGAIVDPELFP